MVAVVSGSGLGLFNSGAPSGNSQVGSGRDQAFVNSTTGNLVIQSTDEILTRVGLDVAITRTYNSQGQVDGDNDDGWRMGTNRRVHTHTGTFNSVGAFVTKTFGDGSEVVYRYDQPSGLYRSTEGDGAHDFLRFDDQLQWWFWTD